MTDDSKLMRLACVLFAAKIVMLAVLAVNTRFVMDEFWQFGQTKYLWNGFYETIWPVKSVGYALWYAPAHGIGWDATSTLLAGRIWALCTVFATLAVVAAIARGLGHSWLTAITVLMLLLSVSTYMERSFRLRSETPAILFAALSLWVVVRARVLPTMRSVLAAGVLTGCALLCTQKAVYFNVALGIALVVAFWYGAGVMAALRAAGLLIAGWVAAVLAYCAVMGRADALAVLRQLFIGPAELATTGGSLYEGLERFIYQTLLRNMPFYVIFVVGLLIALFRYRALPAGTQIAAIFTLIVTALVFAHNQPWPYIFAMCLPFLALWAPILWERIVAAAPKRRKFGSIVVALLVVMTFGRNVDYLDHPNTEQLKLVRTAEAILGPEGTYFDGIGLLPNVPDTPRRWLDAPGIARVKAAPEGLMDALNETPPDLIIETYRTDNLPQTFGEWIADHYVAVAPGLLVRGAELVPGAPAQLNVLETTRFAVSGGAGAQGLRVDGANVTLPIALSAGTYDVLWSGEDNPVQIVPEGTPIPERQTSRQPLFSQTYTR